MEHTRRPRCLLFPYKEDIMSEGHCVHCVSVTEYHPIYYTDNSLEVSCEVSINTSCCHECQDVTDHRVKRAQSDVLRILGVNWPFFPAPYGNRKERIIFGRGDVIVSLLRSPWILKAADLDTFYSQPIISTYFTDSIHCFMLPVKEFMKRKFCILIPIPRLYFWS